VSEQGLGFDNLSLEKYRQDLLEELQQHEKKYKQMPKGVYTGFKADKAVCAEPGMIALLGYPARPPQTTDYQYQTYDLIYINMKGQSVLLNQKEVLDALAHHKDQPRYVPERIDQGDERSIQTLVDSIKAWLHDQAVDEEKQADGTTEKKMGKEAKDWLNKLKTGDGSALKRIQQNVKVTDKYQANNFDLIVWFLVN